MKVYTGKLRPFTLNFRSFTLNIRLSRKKNENLNFSVKIGLISWVKIRLLIFTVKLATKFYGTSYS